MRCACQSGCYYICVPHPSHPLRYFKDVYKPAGTAQRLWLKGWRNSFGGGHRCAMALRPECALLYITYLFLKWTFSPGCLFRNIIDHIISRLY